VSCSSASANSGPASDFCLAGLRLFDLFFDMNPNPLLEKEGTSRGVRISAPLGCDKTVDLASMERLNVAAGIAASTR